ISLLEPLVEAENFPREPMEVVVTTHLWAGNYEDVVFYSNRALRKYPDNFFRLKKALALAELERNKEALSVLEEILQENPDDRDAIALQTLLFNKKKNQLAASYLNTSFSSPGAKPWHLFYLEYKRSIEDVPVLARLSYGNIFSIEGTQVEVDAYPKVTKNSYLYLNVGAALNTPIFPQFRAGAEYFFNIGNGFSSSLGGKYLDFEEDQVFLLTGEAAFNTENNWKITYRPYLSKFQKNWLLSHTFAFRKNMPLKEQFFQFDLQYGSIPYVYLSSNSFTELTSLRAGFHYQFRISENVLLQPILMYEYEEFSPGNYRNKYHSQLVAKFRF
ncbi:MAG TPA: YaiO family outer membrane beta-barrel protein, partial [Salinimicrobium sp.]|nr:YaiO family outer membrane beta-barrel protein [Salinimicrobium sp.]